MSLELVILSVVLPLLLDEFLQWSTVLATLLIKLSTQGLPEKLRERLQEEWLGELEAYPGKLSKLLFALDTFRAAYRIDHNLRLSGTSILAPLVVRLYDITVSLVLLILVFPNILIVFIALKLVRRGSILNRQVVVGRDGKLITCLRFRSVNPRNTNSRRAIDKPRLEMFLYKVRLGLDELPLLFNVLRGDMSYVGPRPMSPDQFAAALQKIPGYEKRLLVRPGITGLAQINPDSYYDLEKSLAYDLLYLKQYGLSTNLRVMFKTARDVLFGTTGVRVKLKK